MDACPTDAIFSPSRAAIIARFCEAARLAGGRIRVTTNFRAELDDRLVHFGLDAFLQEILPCARISWMCDRSSRVSGSTIWNSSSMPMVKTCSFFLHR